MSKIPVAGCCPQSKDPDTSIIAAVIRVGKATRQIMEHIISTFLKITDNYLRNALISIMFLKTSMILAKSIHKMYPWSYLHKNVYNNVLWRIEHKRSKSILSEEKVVSCEKRMYNGKFWKNHCLQWDSNLWTKIMSRATRPQRFYRLIKRLIKF